MKNAMAIFTLCSVLTAPALAQLSPSQTNLDPSAARMEKRNAQPGELTHVGGDQATSNALARCANLPAAYRVDCESRVQGQGRVDGSVLGGGLVKETVTTIPASERQHGLQAEPPATRPTQRP